MPINTPIDRITRIRIDPGGPASSGAGKPSNVQQPTEREKER
jgi:hypothetical protein